MAVRIRKLLLMNWKPQLKILNWQTALRLSPEQTAPSRLPISQRLPRDRKICQRLGDVQQDEGTYPNGTHVCEVEIDPETGETEIVRYIAVDDFGVVVNPMLLAGQIHGGLAQGIAQALTKAWSIRRMVSF